MSDIISFDRDIKPLRKNFFGMGGMNPEDMERFSDAYRRDLNPLLEANIKYREDQRRRKREDFLFKQQKYNFRQEKQKQKLARQARQDDPTLSQELANITEMDDSKAAMAELMTWSARNSQALSNNPSLSNTQVMVSNILKSKADEESSNEMLLAKQIESFIASGDFETAATMAQGVKNSMILDTLNRNIAAARKSKTSAEANRDAKREQFRDSRLEVQKEDWEEASKLFEQPEDFKPFDPDDPNKRIKFNDLSPLEKIESQGKPSFMVTNMINNAIAADRRSFADFLNEDAEDILKDSVRGNQLLKLVDQYYRLGGAGFSRGATPTVNAGE